ncbi:uncharacterized protein LOC135714296 [Ochlerotatus camptorhynchus]|uniref:uncharacterized protein LOC135714296 n=1 Tax=Ochlerotatus camptorhynchus TaxID=644619 RepID=UPI0031E34CCF
MFKIVCLFAVIAVALVSAEPKPNLVAYSAPLVAAAPAAFVSQGSAVYERTFHGNTAPFAPVAAYASAPYVAAPLAYSAYPAPYYTAGAPVFVK